MAAGDPTLGLGIPRSCSLSVLSLLFPCSLPGQPSQLWLLRPVPSSHFPDWQIAWQPLEPVREHEAPTAALGIHSPQPTAAQLEPGSLCMTVSLVYSSISPWMRRKRGIFPLYSCFRIVEYTSSPGHSGRGMHKGTHSWKSLPGPGPLATELASHSPSPGQQPLGALPAAATALPSNRTREFSSGLKGA